MRMTLSQAIGSPQDVGPIILKSTVASSLAALFYAVLFTRETLGLSTLISSVGVGMAGGMIAGIGLVVLFALIKRAENQS